MRWLKRMFSKKDKETIEQIEQPEEREHKHKCTTCNKPIYIGDKWSKVQGMYFHRKCLKSLKQQF